jgi:lipoprotein-anchoring transpeptidase ErfK/SrfK
MKIAPIVLAGMLATVSGAQARTARLDAGTVESAQPGAPRIHGIDPAVLKAQILLDRLRFGPGAIDGHTGETFEKALRDFQQAHSLDTTGRLDEATWRTLTEADSEPVMKQDEVTGKDVRGPFVKRIPRRMEAQAHLKRLSYRSVDELLSERYHVTPALLKALNPGRLAAGRDLLVPDVKRPETDEKVTRIEVRKPERRLLAFGADGRQIADYPASIGSDEKPAPSGDFEVKGVARNPTYRYNPAYSFKGVAAKKPFTIAPGPNNPVGLVWIDLSAESYGIHGTPEPEHVGKTESHGCIRLTNWDALDLASMVKKGTEVDFVD